MNESAVNAGPRGPVRTGLVLVALLVKLTLVTAMANRHIADFVYQGF